jgi:DNA helicase-4
MIGPQTWRPTPAGILLTTRQSWALTLHAGQFALNLDGTKVGGSVLILNELRMVPGIIWAALTFRFNDGRTFELDGIPNSEARSIISGFESARKEALRQVHVTKLLRDFDKTIKPVLQWARKAREACLKQIEAKGWLTHQFKQAFNRVKPLELLSLLEQPEIRERLGQEPQTTRDAVDMWQQSFDSLADGINQHHLLKERQASRTFFDTVEKSPLTDEQIEAVVCFDNRVLVVASAGSGKTSTMVAKAGYALEKGYFKAEQVLLLAFNNDAAAELRGRLKARLNNIGLPGDEVTAKTFHSFGLEIIGAATGKRPTLARWLEDGSDLATLLEIVDELKDNDSTFRATWDLFRLVLGQDLPKFGHESKNPDGWDSESRREGFWTLNNEVVKSRGEQLIANWLFYNGVNYIYEAAYKHPTADASHRQYQPDFYFPELDAYLEHWALDERGEPPEEFVGYKEGMLWKRSIHAKHGTTLLETTMAELWSGKAIKYLSKELMKRRVVLDPNPDRPVPGRKPIENPRLARTFRSFLTHTKSNRFTVGQLRQRLKTGDAGHFRFRHTMFLNLFESIWAAWESKLRAEDCIDFEDMLNLASDCIEKDQWTSPYELVMVDEFQDSSQARARLVAGLVKQPGRCFFAVGDDWQSINRFAGADHGLMAAFEGRFGAGVTLRLEQTFRCPQSLCDISSLFVQKNPKQLKKNVRSAASNVKEPVVIIKVDDPTKIRSAVSKRVQDIAATTTAGLGKAKVYVLGRYNTDRQYMPATYDAARVTVEFLTVHSAKGLEADHVILPKMTNETLGFPCRVGDDPILQLAMPDGDSFENAEERRLFYVALTRAKTSVTLITVARRESTFIAELAKNHELTVCNLDGEVSADDTCPACRLGILVKRTSQFGPFYGCSRYPKCEYKIDSRSNGSQIPHRNIKRSHSAPPKRPTA